MNDYYEDRTWREIAAEQRARSNCWCGMDHAKMDMDYDGNWYELPDDEEDDE